MDASLLTALRTTTLLAEIASAASQQGMRSLTVHMAAYEGAGILTVSQIALGNRPTMNSARAFAPVEIEDNGADHAEYGLPRYAMADGRHRVAAALSAGAKSVRCIVRSGDERTEVVARIA